MESASRNMVSPFEKWKIHTKVQIIMKVDPCYEAGDELTFLYNTLASFFYNSLVPLISREN
jgi:hypothetical protein